ncbi:MAG: hypothetical protein ACTSV5_07945 [Promethearchaeota archaeon]
MSTFVQIFRNGSLHLDQSHFPATPPKHKIKSNLYHHINEEVPHIASPDVHVIHHKKEIRMYYHGLESSGHQLTRVAVSKDGIYFNANQEILTPPYLRVIYLKGYYYGVSMPGIFFRSLNGIDNFERGPILFPSKMRHFALRIDGNQLQIFWTRVGDSPERILLSFIDISEDWLKWKPSSPIEVLRPEMDWEGSNINPNPSIRGPIYEWACQLRDPAIFEENKKTYLLYSTAGERGIGIAEISIIKD